MINKEQIKGFYEAYKKIKEVGFENYFCLTSTTWKQANNNFKKGFILQDEISVQKLRNNVNIILKTTNLKNLYIGENCECLKMDKDGI